MALVGLYLPQPILPLLAEEFAVDARTASLVVSIAILGIALAAPVTGVLSDRYGRRAILLLGSALLAVASLASAWAPSLGLLLGSRLALGLLLPTLLVVGVAYAADAIPARAMRSVAGVYVAATVAGGMTGRVVGGVLADALSWRHAFMLSALLYAALVPLWWRLPALEAPTAGRTLRGAVAGTLGHLRNPALTGGILVAFCVAFAFQGTFTYLPFRVAVAPFHFSSTAIALLYLSYTAGMVSASLAGRVHNRMGLRGGLVLGFVLTVTGNVLSLATSVPVLVAALLVLCSGSWIVHSLALGYVATAAPNDRGGANALYLLLYYLGGSAGAYLPGFLFLPLGYGGVVAGSVAALVAGLGIAAWLTGGSGSSARPDLQPSTS